jgi:hypothetical protein
MKTQLTAYPIARVITRISVLIACVTIFSMPAFSQATLHIFPQIADGSAGGQTCRSTLMIHNATSPGLIDCTLRLYSLLQPATQR